VVSMVVATMASIIVAVSQQRRTRNDRDLAHQEMERIRRLSISAVVLGTMATFLIFCLSPGIIRQTLTCFVYVLTVLSMMKLLEGICSEPTTAPIRRTGCRLAVSDHYQ